MPRKTNSEKIDELMISVAEMVERRDAMRRELDRLSDLPVRVAVLEQRFHDMQQGQERWLNRFWMLLAPLVGAVAGSLLTYFLAIKK